MKKPVRFDPELTKITLSYLNQANVEVLYERAIVELTMKYGISFTQNPGGGEFFKQGWGRCQVPLMDTKEDYEILSKWIKETRDGTK